MATYHKKGRKCIIEVDFDKLRRKEKEDAFQSILSISEDIGIKDWSVNHDHYLYGTPKQETEE